MHDEGNPTPQHSAADAAARCAALHAADSVVSTGNGEERNRSVIDPARLPDLTDTDAFTRLPVQAPPMLEAAIGYTGDARFVAFYWGAGDEGYYNDGCINATGWGDAYLAFVHHREIAPALEAYDLGSSENTEPSHYLVLDRSTREIFAAPVGPASVVLTQQWPQLARVGPASKPGHPAVQLAIDGDDLCSLFSLEEFTLESAASVSADQLYHTLMAQDQLRQDIINWLDAHAGRGASATSDGHREG